MSAVCEIYVSFPPDTTLRSRAPGIIHAECRETPFAFGCVNEQRNAPIRGVLNALYASPKRRLKAALHPIPPVIDKGQSVDWYLLGPFLLATLLVVMAPGPIMAIVAHNTIRHGTAAGLLTVVGVELGELCLLTATFTGVAASAELFPLLFRWLGLAGTLYLLWLAASALRPQCIPVRNAIATRTRMPVVQGLTVAATNPAAIVFYTAFFPQFLHPDRPVAQQTVALGAIYLCTALTFDLVLVLTLGRIQVPAAWGRFGGMMKFGSTAVYLAIAIIGVVGFVKASS
jgi:homoserine/homoserine lactone efflux protein